MSASDQSGMLITSISIHRCQRIPSREKATRAGCEYWTDVHLLQQDMGLYILRMCRIRRSYLPPTRCLVLSIREHKLHGVQHNN